MKKAALKWILIGGALVFILLYGIEMSSSGIERIYGPVEGSNQRLSANESSMKSAEKEYKDALADLQQRKIALLEQELTELRELAVKAGYSDASIESDWKYSRDYYDRLLGLPIETEQAGVDKLADSASGMLQAASSGGIRFVVSLFEGLTK